jgi:DNA-directed RNA polymerase specialized sigma24 family protein
MEDIGAILDKSPAAAKLLIYRAVQRLRAELASQPEATRIRQPVPA